MRNSILLSDLPLAAVVIVVAFAAALPAYATVRKGRPGRARGSIAYLAGFAFGLIATIGLGALLEPLAVPGTPVAVVGAIAAFVGPLLGMVHAKLAQPPRRRPRGALEYPH
jgi:hypothetical protein